MPDFGQAERRILKYMEVGTKFFFKNKEYCIIESGKPTCVQGEPKTDIYVLADSGQDIQEIKISYKKENADFIENKMNRERAEQLFGEDWRVIIEEATRSIANKFEEKPLIYKEKKARTEKGAITLGWKFELLNKIGGELSGKMELTEEQLYSVYAGDNLSCDKKDSFVNGRQIQNSGVANYILMKDDVKSAQEVIDYMLPIRDYINQYPEIYFACKALNYRTFKNKYDGDRPLSVQVQWTKEDNKLLPQLIYNMPLELNGKSMAERLLSYMKVMNISNTDDINEDNTDMNYVYDK